MTASKNLRRTNRGIVATLVSALAIGALAGCVGTEQPGPTALPLRPTATADFATGELQRDLEAIIEAGAPGAVIEVRVGDRVWSAGAGVASLRSELPARPEQTFRAASLTKTMVAAIVLQLVDEGKLALDDDFRTYFPQLFQDAPGPVTIRQLLQHTSGLNDYIDQLGLETPERIPEILATKHELPELLKLATDQGWRSEPGTEFFYSNANYVALSMLIEQVDERTLAESLAARITEPLGLKATRLPEGTELGADHLSGYFIEQGLSIEVTQQDASLWSGAGGVESTVSDINTFMRALLTGAVVPPELLAEMAVLGDDGYGLGLQGRIDPCPDPQPAMLQLEDAVPQTAAAPTAGAGTPVPDGSELPDATGQPESQAPDEAEAGVAAADATDAAADASVAPTAPESLPPTAPTEVEIGRAGFVYGHLGSGLGYRAVTFTSPDGVRQVTIAWNGSPADYASDPRLEIAYRLADEALEVDCAATAQ